MVCNEGGIKMKSEIDILNHINGLIVEMNETKQSMQKNGTNLFFHMEHKRMLMSKATEIKHLCWAVDIEVPKKVYDLL